MTYLFFLESQEDISVLRQYLAQGDTIIALTPMAAFGLDKAGLSYKTLEGEYYSHLDICRALAGYKTRIIQIMDYLDSIVFNIDIRFKEMGLRPFLYSLFDAEVPFLSIATRMYEIKSVLDKDRPARVKIVSQGELVSINARFTENGSLINEIIGLLKAHYGYELITYNKPCRRRVSREEAFVNMHKAHKDLESICAIITKKVSRVVFLLKNLKNSIFFSGSLFFLGFLKKMRRRRILNVGCWELDCLAGGLLDMGWVIDDFPCAEFTRNHNNSAKKDYMFKRQLEEVFSADENLQGMFKFLDIPYFGLINRHVFGLCGTFESMIDDYRWLGEYIKDRKFDIAFFQTHSGWSPQNKLLPIILKSKKIPYVCWMHGGYGANIAVSGYESSDYLLGQRYFVYGEAIKRLIDTHYSAYNLKTYTAGSPYLENSYSSYVRPKNKKKVITYVLSPFAQPLNQLYSEECARYKRFGYWPPIKNTLDVLSKYSGRYHIILRPHINRQQVWLLREYLKGAAIDIDIEIISIEKSRLRDILFKTDLVISNSMSTAFFEAALTSADIFLLDDSDLTKEAQAVIAERAFHFRQITDFCRSLDAYLGEGRFYQRNGGGFVREFLDIDKKAVRAQKVSYTLDAILDN